MASFGWPIAVLTVLLPVLPACYPLLCATLQGWLHGDIKPANIVWDAQRSMVSLIDWGCARQFFTPDVEGNTVYMPPEYFMAVTLADGTLVHASNEPGFETLIRCQVSPFDVWAAALVLLYWHVGTLPEKLLSPFAGVRCTLTQEDINSFLQEHVQDPELLRFFLDVLLVNHLARWFCVQVVGHPYIAAEVSEVSDC